MTCPQIRSHALPLHPESPPASRSARSRRGHARARVATDSFHSGNPSSRLAHSLCSDRAVTGSSARPLTLIPGLLRQAERSTALALGSASPDAARVELDRAVEAYNGAVQSWHHYEVGRPAGAPLSGLVRGLAWAEIRGSLVAAAEQRGFRLQGLEDAPADHMVFRTAESQPTRMSEAQVSNSVLRLTRLRNRIQEFDAIEDDTARTMGERLLAARSAVRLVREAAGVVEQLRDRAPNPGDPRIARLSREILHAACDDPNEIRAEDQNGTAWVAGVVRFYHRFAEDATRMAFHGRGREIGSESHFLMARLRLLRARRASFALSMASDQGAVESMRSELGRERVALQRGLVREQGRIVVDQVREASRLLAHADRAFRRGGRRISVEARESARADHQRAQEILSYLSEISTGDRRVSRLRQDPRWARVEAAIVRTVV